MSDSKEFLGKTLDAAIAEACSYYDVPREKLEIEIIEDAKTGIFGIVGARKAKIRARLATLPDFMQSGIPQEKTERQDGRRRGRSDRRKEKSDGTDPQKEEQKESRKENRESRQERGREESGSPSFEEKILPAVRTAGVPALTAEPPADRKADAPDPEEHQERSEELTEEAPKGKRCRQPRGSTRRDPAPRNDDADALESTLPRIPLAELDQEQLTGVTKNIISRLVAPILDAEPAAVDLSLEIGDDRVQVSVKSEDTGLLIGRDGQNLAAVQYLASRMITKAMGSQVRLQVDAGNYHMRQDSRLQELALNLAEKVKSTGKVQTTRPLSAYQRRVIHLALQDDPEVQTRSSGEGALKHVVILKRKD